jgi:ATP-dependent DNA ligase I
MIPLGEVVATWLAVRAASGRLDKRRHMAALFARLAGDDLRLAASYLSGDLGTAPAGVGWAAIQAALQALAPVAGEPLRLAEVDETFAALAATSGAGSQRRRGELLAGLFGRATDSEREFLVGLMSGELRQGALRALVLDALAEARGLDVAALRRAVMHSGSLADTLATLERGGAAALGAVQLRPLVPVEPMLAATAGDIGQALAELGGRAAAEWKLDGVRVQVHKDAAAVKIFTRSLRDVTAGAPELAALAQALPATSAILDGEAVALGDGESPVPFQDLMSDFQEKGRAGGTLQAMFFDVLYLDGEPLVDRPDEERRARLEALLPRERVIPRRLVASAAEVEAALEEALAAGHEGLVLKALAAPYAAGRRGSNWRKVKRAVTLDLVILAAEWGHGRRRGWLSNLHLGARDATDATRFWMLGKTFKGLTDQMLREQTQSLLGLAVDKGTHVVRVRPELVVEIAFDAVLRSTRYDSGLALRFARVKRFRADKRASDATTIDEIRKLSRPGPSGDADA